MREISDAAELSGVSSNYPNLRKVTVDDDNRTAYVFTGRSNQATTVTGEEFDALVKALPAEGGKARKGAEVEPDEAVISAVKEEPNAAEAKPQARAKRQKESER